MPKQRVGKSNVQL